jgi:HAD superfamily hydrolase (TIGR01509 family)
MSKLKALIFDFDGLILDTETAEVDVWREIYAEYGLEFPILKWVEIVGGSGAVHFDAAEYLCERAGGLDIDELNSRYDKARLERIGQQEVLPGVVVILDEAREAGLKLGIASSSPLSWVEGHLRRLGLFERFEVVCTRDDVEITKPDPELFKLAAERLGVGADEVIVLEDSLNGVLAAKEANMFVVAVPNQVTAHTDLSGADVVLGSLAQTSVNKLTARLE